jgi:hypothetical protein
VRHRVKAISIGPLDPSAASSRSEFMLILRQLAWLRDIGLACQVQDLARPWQDLASAFGSN